MAAEYAPEPKLPDELEGAGAQVFVLADHGRTAPPVTEGLTPAEALVTWMRRNDAMGYGLFRVVGGPRPAGDGWKFVDSFPSSHDA